MTVVIGWNQSQPIDKQWTEVEYNSHAISLILWLISNALEKKYPNIYWDITERISIHLIKFDELNQHDFMTAVMAIRNLIEKEGNSIKENAEYWNSDIEPLIIIDDRYDPNFKLDE